MLEQRMYPNKTFLKNAETIEGIEGEVKRGIMLESEKILNRYAKSS